MALRKITKISLNQQILDPFDQTVIIEQLSVKKLVNADKIENCDNTSLLVHCILLCNWNCKCR